MSKRIIILGGGGRKRNVMMVWTILSLCVLIPLSASAAARELTFSDGLARMRQNHEALLAASQRVENRREMVAAARGLNWPKVDLQTRFTRIDDPITIDLSPIREAMLKLHPAVPSFAVPPFSLEVQDSSFWRTEANMTWPVYAGGRISAMNRAAEAGIVEAQAAGERTAQNLTSELVRRYFGIQVALHVMDVRRMTYRTLAEHLRQARRLEEEGLIARAERLHAEVALAEADRVVKRSEKDVEIARIALDRIVSDGEGWEVVSPLFITDKLEPFSHFLEKIAAEHPILKEIAAKRRQAAEGISVEQAQWLPEVYVFGMCELDRGDLTVLDPTWAVGVGANFLLFDGGTRSHRIRAAKGVEKEAAILEREVARDINMLAEKRYRELMQAHEQYQSLQAALSLAEENVRTRRLAFGEGLATSLDVVDSELSLSGIRIERLRSAYAFDVSLAEFLEACGQSDRFETYRLAAQGVQ
jgi:outer membrane protein TolC